jgi:hypothetical protein
MFDQPKHQSALGAIWHRWRYRTHSKSELEICEEEGDLLLGRMTALDLDPTEVVNVEPRVFRDMQRVCIMCKSHKRCIADLGRDAQNSAWKNYCPNVHKPSCRWTRCRGRRGVSSKKQQMKGKES